MFVAKDSQVEMSQMGDTSTVVVAVVVVALVLVVVVGGLYIIHLIHLLEFLTESIKCLQDSAQTKTDTTLPVIKIC